MLGSMTGICRQIAPTCALLITAATLAIGAPGCGTSNDLYGSISESNDLQYDSTLLGVQTTSITISYLRNGGGLVAKLAIDTNGLTLASGATLSGNDFMSHVALTRSVTDVNQVFPPVARGSINFENYSLAAGGSLSGHFAVTFTTGDLLEGDFSGNLVDQSTSSQSTSSALIRAPVSSGRRFCATPTHASAISLLFD